MKVMDTTDIAFPNLGIYLENVPRGFYVGEIYIALYGVVIGLGMMLGILIAARAAKRIGHDPEIIWDFALYAVIVSILGARLYYVVFQWEEYKDNLLDVFKLRQGGLAIYGAVIGAFMTLFVFSKVKKHNPFWIGDCGVQGLILGQALGRWGNFFNREVFGEYTDNILAMRLPVAGIRDTGDISESIRVHMAEDTNYIQVHPTFLYESLLNLLLFVVMVWYHKRRKFDGEVCLLYLGGYGIVRFFVEGIRTDQLKLWNTDIAVSQVLGMALFVISVAIDVTVRIRLKKKESKTTE